MLIKLRYLVDNTIVIYPCKHPFLTSKNGMLNRNTPAEETTGHLFRDHHPVRGEALI